MLEYLIDGGVIMIPLFCLSVLALAVIIDRLRVFRKAHEADTDALFNHIKEHIDQNDIPAAIEACRQIGGPVAAVQMIGLEKYRTLLGLNQEWKEIEPNLDKTISEYAPHVIELLEKRLNLLLMVGSVSPLLGMTGTVIGMIASFNSLQAAGGLDGGAVAGGISTALITTAAGLLVAIPAVVFYNIFTRKVDTYTLEIEEKSSDLVEYLHLYGPGAAKP